MADVVQFRLERMVDELEDLEGRGLFRRDEIAEVVRRRRDFEYRLKRPRPLKQDFLAYVDYETQLDALRVIRKKKILGELSRRLRERGARGETGEGKKKSGKLWKRSISDVAGVLRILEIYRLAVLRYKGDLDLWFRYLEFCRERRHGRMKQVLAQAIRFHPKVPGLWIYAAAWEFDQNLNVAAARALMQNGLRECPTSEDIWIEYLRMELTYLNKLKARKVALGEDVRTLDRDGSDEARKWKEENGDLFMSLDEEEVGEGSELQQGALKRSENFFWEQGSDILRTIYHGAVEAIPSSMSLRKRFLEILDNVDLAHSDELKGEVMEGIKQQFSQEEDYWDWIARLELSDILKRKDLTKEEAIGRLKKVVQVYEESLHLLPSAKMFSLYTKFLLDVFVPEVDGTYYMFSSLGIDVVEFASDILTVYEKAESCGCLTDDLAHQYVSYYLQMGKLDEARKLAARLCNGKLSKAVNLWSLRISIEMKWLTSKSLSISKDDLNHIFELLGLAVSKVANSETEILWQKGIEFFSNRKEHFKKLVESFMTHLAKIAGDDSGYSISCAIVNWVFQRDGIQRARDMYKRFLSLPHPGLAFFRFCIGLESNLLFAGDNNALANARKIYESALRIYGEDDGIWRDYYSFEVKVGTSETANAVYWRCRKAHKDVILLSTPNNL
uniref:U3 small nucleolar RNA-associated protein 6 n=1 Tax=Anthurium amnicola TaxID=1678845 RepID=A0A1D1Z1E6_9ARAE